MSGDVSTCPDVAIGVDGDGELCRFSYDLNKKMGRLELKPFSFLPTKMIFHEKFKDLYFNVFAGNIKHSSYSIVVEGVDLNDPKLVLQT
jgi:hypothetical protein